jgi:DNA-binding NtrC family response regulator
MGQAAFRGSPRRRTVVFQGQVLLIENLRSRCQLMCDMLTQAHLEVGVVENAWEAVQWLSEMFPAEQARVPELILCNAQMLGDIGLAALEEWCASNPDVPIILYSAFTTPKLRERMARIGGAWILEEAPDLEELRSAALSLAASRQTSL